MLQRACKVSNEFDLKLITYRLFLSVLLAVRLLQDCEKQFFRIALPSEHNDGMRCFIEYQAESHDSVVSSCGAQIFVVFWVLFHTFGNSSV